MKAIIFVALVASVAARSLDLDTLRLIREKSLLNRPIVDDALVKESLLSRVPLERQTVGDVVDVLPKTVVPVERNVYDYDRVYTIDEIFNTQLIREYFQLPYFRQYIQYPSFQRYVASIYFQRFWTVPSFKQYFVNPVLFYKYIYPIVQLFNSEYTQPIDTTYSYGRRDVLNQDIFGLQGLVDDAVVRNRNVLPYVYNNRYSGLTYGQQYLPYTTATTNYKFLLDRLYRNLYVNQPTVADVTEVQTDVKVFPAEKKVVVEPITGEQKVVVEDPKIVDVKVDQKVVPVEKVQVPVETVETVDTVYDVQLLKKLVKLNVITPDIYEQIIAHQIDLPTVLLRERVITPEIYQLVVLHKLDLTTVLRQILGFEYTSDIVSPFVGRRDVYDNVYGYPVNRVNYNYNKLYNYLQ